jgi:transcriptional regulator with XRE-family HTH domain
MSISTQPAAGPDDAAERARVLTRALLSVAELLELSQRELALVLGASEASVSRMARGGRELAVPGKEAELAALLVRLYRALDSLVGGSREQALAWFRAANHHLGGVPAERVRSIEGLVDVVHYLDAMRGKL